MWRLAPTRTRHADDTVYRRRCPAPGHATPAPAADLIVLEATGALEPHGVRPTAPGWLADGAGAPRRVRALAHAEGRQAKTDRFWMPGCSPALPNGCARRTTKRRTSSAHPCATCWSGGSRLILMRTAEINRLTAAAPNLRPGIQQHIDWLDHEIRALEQEPTTRRSAPTRCAGNGSCSKACPASARSPHGTCCAACPNWGPSIARKRRPL
jgi:hypothetical protein